VKDEVEGYQGNKGQRENEMEVAPVVPVQPPEVLFRLRAAAPRNEEAEKYPDEHYDQDHDDQQCTNNSVPMGFFHGDLLSRVLTAGQFLSAILLVAHAQGYTVRRSIKLSRSRNRAS
jgi:hypothetical protein